LDEASCFWKAPSINQAVRDPPQQLKSDGIHMIAPLGMLLQTARMLRFSKSLGDNILIVPQAMMPVCASVFSESRRVARKEDFARFTGDPRLMRSIRLSLR
jgi:hypothetical protein